MATPVHISEAWIRAQDEFVKDLNDEEQKRFFRASPESLLEDATNAEKSHGTKSTTRKVMEKLQPFVAAIQQYGEAIDLYSSTYSLALGPIWGSIRVLLHIAHEFGKYFDKLVEMFVRIGDVLPRFRTYERLFSNHERLINALSIAYLDIITFCTSAKAVFRRGQCSSKTTLKVTLKLLWKPFDVQFGQQLSTFREHQKNVEKEAGLANMIEAADARAIVLADQKQLEMRRRENNRLKILAMLQPVDYEAKHRKLQSLRHAGTGEWLFRQAAYVEWKTPGNSAFLCCRGIPGCGKSILASNLVDHLIGPVPQFTASTSDVIYYYCDYTDQRTLQFDRILGSLLKQLFLNSQIPEHIESQLLQIYSRGTRSPPENTLGDIFCSIFELRPDICIVLDGLDECDRNVWQAMLRILKRLAAARQCTVKTFVTCVEEGSLAHHLKDLACIQLCPATTTEDITTFVASSVRSKIEDGDLRVRNAKLEQDIVSELVSRANGMFLWVFFQLNDLCESSSDAMIRETLRNLPDGLGDTYGRILVKIGQSRSRAKLARTVFQWATVAKRPLHIEELREAVAFGLEDKCWNEDKVPHEDLMFEACRGLIIKDEEDGTAHFAHHTVRQYLTGGLATRVDRLWEISVDAAEIIAGHTCVAYLSFSDFETQITSNTHTVAFQQKGVLEPGGPLQIPSILGIRRPIFEVPYRLFRGDTAMRSSNIDYGKYLKPNSGPKGSLSTDLKDKYRLLSYTIEYWEPHTRGYQSPNFPLDSVFNRRLESLAKHKTLAFAFRPWGPNQHFGPYGCVGCPSPSTKEPTSIDLTYMFASKDLPCMSMIHYAAEVGNLGLLKLLHSDSPELSDYLYHERYHNRTLLIACSHGRTEIVKHLVEQSSSSFWTSYERAINAAVAAGHAEVVEYLLSLDYYSIKRQYDAALHSAVENGHVAVVEMLAEAGANLNSRDRQTGWSVLESAANHGHENVIRTLIQRGARPNDDPELEKSILNLAVANGHAAATRALLEAGFLRDDSGRNDALSIAAKSGHIAVAKALLDYGANPWSTGSGTKHSLDDMDIFATGVGPFHLAAQGGHVELLETLRGHTTNLKDRLIRPSKTVLHFAAAGGHEKAIRWLVENGANVNGVGSDGATPLFWAIKVEKEISVRVLLELGAKVIDLAAVFNPLDLAAWLGNKPIIDLLLESIRRDRQSSIRTKRSDIQSALGAARGTDTINFALLKLSVQRPAVRGSGRTAGRVVVAELLELELERYSE